MTKIELENLVNLIPSTSQIHRLVEKIYYSDPSLYEGAITIDIIEVDPRDGKYEAICDNFLMETGENKSLSSPGDTPLAAFQSLVSLIWIEINEQIEHEKKEKSEG